MDQATIRSENPYSLRGMRGGTAETFDVLSVSAVRRDMTHSLAIGLMVAIGVLLFIAERKIFWVIATLGLLGGIGWWAKSMLS